jgi:hypothetical protein
MMQGKSGGALARGTVGVILALCACLPARATVLFEYRAICELECQNIGLTTGEPVGGVIGIADEAVANGAITGPFDITAFSIDFGVFHFDLASLGTAFAQLSAAHDEALVFEFVTSAPGNAPGYAFAQTNWIAGNSVLEAAFGGPGTLTEIVPEPAPWLLFAGALLALLVVPARARRQRSQGAATSASMP